MAAFLIGQPDIAPPSPRRLAPRREPRVTCPHRRGIIARRASQRRLTGLSAALLSPRGAGRPDASVDPLRQLDDDRLRATDVAEPIDVCVVLDLANELAAAGSHGGDTGVDVVDCECDVADAPWSQQGERVATTTNAPGRTRTSDTRFRNSSKNGMSRDFFQRCASRGASAWCGLVRFGGVASGSCDDEGARGDAFEALRLWQEEPRFMLVIVEGLHGGDAACVAPAELVSQAEGVGHQREEQPGH
jgi:hypothetical protein